MRELIVILAKMKKGIFEVIRDDDTNHWAGNFFDAAIVAIIIVNIIVMILDTFTGLPEAEYQAFKIIEVVSVIIFTVEYALRIWTAPLLFPEMTPSRARFRYARSFMALVDLLAILPFYLPVVVRIDLRALRMVRLLRMLRILKMNRYTNALSTVGLVIKKKAAQLISSMLVVLVLMVMASILMYNIEYEAQPNVFQNAFSGLWWAVATLTTVGYGDIYPITVLGKILSAVIAIMGIALVAVPTGIISAGFIEGISTEKEEKHYCPYCGKKLE